MYAARLAAASAQVYLLFCGRTQNTHEERTNIGHSNRRARWEKGRIERTAERAVSAQICPRLRRLSNQKSRNGSPFCLLSNTIQTVEAMTPAEQQVGLTHADASRLTTTLRV